MKPVNRRKALVNDDDAPAVQPSMTVPDQPRRLMYSATGQRIERAIGYRTRWVTRTDEEASTE